MVSVIPGIKKLSHVSLPNVSLIITTFDSPYYLEQVLQSVLDQTVRPREVLVADDGSGVGTRELLSRWTAIVPIKPSWQPNQGFRAAAARNLAIIKARQPYLIFIDGDCMLPPRFVESHLRLSSQSKMLSGGRYLARANSYDQAKDESGGCPKLWSLPLGPLRDVAAKKWTVARTCNLSMYREMALRVRGFDESYIGWGREDSDFVVRLIRSGIKLRSARFAATVIHLKHDFASRVNLSTNDARLDSLLADLSRVQSRQSRIGEV